MWASLAKLEDAAIDRPPSARRDIGNTENVYMPVQNDSTATSIRTQDLVCRTAETGRAGEASDVQGRSAVQPAQAGAQPQRAAVDPARQADARIRASGDERARMTAEPSGRSATAQPAARGLSEAGTLRRGGNNDPQQVRELQTRLNERGARLEVDGRFGPRTERAVRDFQRENGLSADGVVGQRTKEKLRGEATSPTRPRETGPTDNPQTPRAPGTDPTMPGSKISGGPNRSQFDRELQNPAVRQRMQTLAVAEVGSHAQAQRAVMETIFNRAQATGKTLMETMNSRYYQPMQNGGGPMRRAEASIRNSPALQRQLDDAMRDVRAGSNVSNYATDNASAGVARAAERSQVITARIGGETFSRKEGRRNGVSHPDYRPWFNNHPRNP